MMAGTAWGREREVIEVSLRPRLPGEVPAQTAEVARLAFPKGCLCMRIREVFGPRLPTRTSWTYSRSVVNPHGRPISWQSCRCCSSWRACRTARRPLPCAGASTTAGGLSGVEYPDTTFIPDSRSIAGK